MNPSIISFVLNYNKTFADPIFWNLFAVPGCTGNEGEITFVKKQKQIRLKKCLTGNATCIIISVIVMNIK